MYCHSHANISQSAEAIHVYMYWPTFITDADGSVPGDPTDDTPPQPLHLLSELTLCTERLYSVKGQWFGVCTFPPPDLCPVEPPNDDYGEAP